MALQIQQHDLGSVVRGERTTFADTGHVPRALNTPKMRILGVFRAQRTCPVAANVVLILLNEILKLKQMWFLKILYVTV